ncbi:hypothetical protein GCM10027280_24970 [Micromonospora polyrhachis]|uniref:Uncharacterized protein n=1 Tax=Micromonospora polyrhachis TaxID=1282883 RepID=A0A7W7WQV5_9ACTN|nr:hypothetical protein [Micromonospora polyrhachis]MBB4960410.1 hypothetical protein [Micromonospora polyrhachis]
MHVAGRLSPDEFWAQMAQHDEQIRSSAHLLPRYGLAGWTGAISTGDWSWEDDRLVTVGLVYGDRLDGGPYVHSRTTVQEPATAVRLLRMATPPHPCDMTELLEREQRLATSPSTEVDISIDGRLERFTRWQDDTHWYASSAYHGHCVVLEVCGVTPDQITLVRVEDIEPYLAGRRSSLHALRGAE